MSQFSKIIIASCTEKDYTSSFYTIETRIYDKKGNLPIIFNHILDYTDEDCILGFLSPYIQLSDSAIFCIMKTFNKYPDISCIYTDAISHHNHLYYPAYHYKLCNQLTINTPLFCKSKIAVRFDESLKYLYYFDFLYKVCQNHIAWHIADPLCTILPYEINQFDAEIELRKIFNGS